jgi:hypothetical protein
MMRRTTTSNTQQANNYKQQATSTKQQATSNKQQATSNKQATTCVLAALALAGLPTPAYVIRHLQKARKLTHNK